MSCPLAGAPRASSSSPICPGCSASVDASIAVICDGCERPMHYSCLGLLSEDCGIINRIHRCSGHVKVLCAYCNDHFKIPLYHQFVNSNPLMESISELVKTAISGEAESLRNEIISLRREVDDLKMSNIDLVRLLSKDVKLGENPVNVNRKYSYANVSKTMSDTKIMIKPKNSSQPVEKTKVDIISKIDPSKSVVMVKGVKTISSGGVILTCNSDEADKLNNIAGEKLSHNYKIQKLTKIKPQVRIVGIPSYMDQESALSSLFKQNDSIFKKDTSLYQCIKFWETRKNKEVFQCILQVDTDTYCKLKSVGNVLVGLNLCSVYNDVNVKRCYKCNGLNHFKKRFYICCTCSRSRWYVNNCDIDGPILVNYFYY